MACLLCVANKDTCVPLRVWISCYRAHWAPVLRFIKDSNFVPHVTTHVPVLHAFVCNYTFFPFPSSVRASMYMRVRGVLWAYARLGSVYSMCVSVLFYSEFKLHSGFWGSPILRGWGVCDGTVHMHVHTWMDPPTRKIILSIHFNSYREQLLIVAMFF